MNRLFKILTFACLTLTAIGLRAERPADLSQESKVAKKKNRIDLGVGLEHFNYRNETAPTIYLQYIRSTPRQYYLLGRFEYVDRFNDRAFSTTLGGGYFVHPKLLLSDEISFAPGTQVLPKFQNQFEVMTLLPHGFTPYLRYEFKLYDDIQLHRITPGISWYLSDWGIFDLNYSASINSFERLPDHPVDHGFSSRMTLIPIEDKLKFFVFYGWSQESFEVENPQRYNQFNAHHFGGGFEWVIVRQVGLNFYFEQERRNNKQTVNRYGAGVFYRF